MQKIGFRFTNTRKIGQRANRVNVSKVYLSVDIPDSHSINSFNNWKIKPGDSNLDLVSGNIDATKRTWIIEGPNFNNSNLKIAEIKIEAKDGFSFDFSKKGYLKTKYKNNIYIELDSKVETNGKTTEVVYCLYYKSNESKEVFASFNYTTIENVTIDKTIDLISVGGLLNIRDSGEDRLIKIIGTPNALFGIAVNENLEEILTLGDETVSHIDKINDVSILSSANSTGKDSHVYGKELSVITGELNNTGSYSFKQKFPSSTVKSTKVNGEKTSTATIVFDSTTGIREGDRIYASSIPSTTVIKVNTVNADGVTLILDTAISILDNVHVTFKRKRCYSVDVLPDSSSTIGSNIPSSLTYKLYQYIDPIITLRHSSATTEFTITHNNGVATGLGRGDEYDIKTTGKANSYAYTYGKRKHINQEIKVSLTIANHDTAGTNFTAISAPFKTSTDSNWSNHNPIENGGTDFKIRDVSASGVGTDTATVAYTIQFIKWGDKDITIDLNLDNILTIA